MRRHVMAVTVAAALAAVPMLASAKIPSDARGTCMRAFVATLPSKAMITPRDQPTSGAAPSLGVDVEEYVLTARDAHTERVLSQVVCTFDHEGHAILSHNQLVLATVF